MAHCTKNSTLFVQKKLTHFEMQDVRGILNQCNRKLLMNSQQNYTIGLVELPQLGLFDS